MNIPGQYITHPNLTISCIGEGGYVIYLDSDLAVDLVLHWKFLHLYCIYESKIKFNILIYTCSSLFALILYTYYHSRTTITGNIMSSLPRIVTSVKHT